MKHKKSPAKIFSFEDFNTRAKTSNYEDMEGLYNELVKEHPDFAP
ncbi:hypothetical protein [Olivibacter sp. SDN3]|nr:hypothetical protein [Olivibacter sp. SDN3]